MIKEALNNLIHRFITQIADVLREHQGLGFARLTEQKPEIDLS